MKQKMIGMTLLLIGILSSFLSCHEDVDKVYYEKFYFFNNTNHKLVIEAYYNEDDYIYSLSKESTLYQKLELNFGSTTDIIAYSDSVVVTFGDIRKVSFLPDTQSPFNILDRDNYTSDKGPDNHHEYRYVFTKDDFNNAPLKE